MAGELKLLSCFFFSFCQTFFGGQNGSDEGAGRLRGKVVLAQVHEVQVFVAHFSYVKS